MQLPQLTKTVGSCLRVWSGTSMSKFVAKKEFKNRPRRETKGSSMFLMNTGEKVSTVGFPQPPPPPLHTPSGPQPQVRWFIQAGNQDGLPSARHSQQLDFEHKGTIDSLSVAKAWSVFPSVLCPHDPRII